jgi:hypothetical protein
MLITLINKLKIDRKYIYLEKLNYSFIFSIHFAITNGDISMFDLLENAGALCHSIVTNGDNTLLHWFCYNKANDENISLLIKLINKGCDVNAENNHKSTPLMLAAKLDMINTCHILLNNHADIDKVDDQGFRAIDLAKLGSECFYLLQTKQKKLQSKHNTDGVLWRKQIGSTRSLSTQLSNPLNPLNNDENKFKRYSLNSFDECNKDEIDTKYKRMWEKFHQTKQRIRRTRDVSLQRTRDSSRPGKRDPSEQRTNIFYQDGGIMTLEL